MANDSTAGKASRAFHPGAFPTELKAPLRKKDSDHMTLQLMEFVTPSTGQILVFATSIIDNPVEELATLWYFLD